MNNLVVLLGAGFSFPAGYPLACDINKRFNRCQKNKIIKLSGVSLAQNSFSWEDCENIREKSPLRDSTSFLYSYILNELVKAYNQEVKIFDYEDFFSYVSEKKFNWYTDIYSKAKEEFTKDKLSLEREYNDRHPYSKADKESFEKLCLQRIESYDFSNTSGKHEILKMIQYLIYDILDIGYILSSEKKWDERIKHYESFIDYIRTFDRVDIFTLNHDVLLEKLLDKKKIPYSRGFSCENSNIYYGNGKFYPLGSKMESEALPQLVFNNCFEEKINIFKLHGSVILMKYPHLLNQEGTSNYTRTNDYTYFTSSKDYDSFHNCIRIDPKTKKVLQKTTFDNRIELIIGREKTNSISQDTMYSQLFKHFETIMGSAKKILISGYSYRDEHVNEELKKREDREVINQNPNDKYPFKVKKVTQIESLTDLSTL